MSQRLTDAIVKTLPVPASGNKITYDAAVKGFGCRITAAGARAFVLNYRTRVGRERRFTIGSWPDWKAAAARIEAAEIKKRVDRGEDPLGDIEDARGAPTVADLCARYAREHAPKKQSRSDDERNIRKHVLPALKHIKVADVGFADVDGLHRKITRSGSPITANRVVALLSKMFALAIRWRWRADNPARGIDRNPEARRTRYLSPDELGRLTAALTAHDSPQAANIVRLLLLTGARRGEVLAARWGQFDLAMGVWAKPASATKQGTAHRVPLSTPALQLLATLRAKTNGDYVFPDGRGGYVRDIKTDWHRLCKAANISGVRLHDVRHTYASVLASAGLGLPVIGALLGHTNPTTTARYAHLFDDPLRAATERAASIIISRGGA